MRLSANQARELSKTNLKNNLNTTLDNLYSAIKEIAENTSIPNNRLMAYSLSLIKNVHANQVIDALKEDGYTVKYISDQRDGDYLEIRW